MLLGVDTGGTYTDAVVLDAAGTRVIGKAKSLTTKADLSLGIGRAMDAALAGAGVAAAEVGLVSLSTTLATNALVEGQGGRVALVFIGFAEADLDRAGLSQALAGDPVIRLAGGHNHAGIEAAALDEDALRAALAGLRGVVGVAVAAQFGNRNPAHEARARAIVREVTGLPVTCAHELSARLNGPKRALTAVLNARLIGMIDGLVRACEVHLARLGIAAPLMVVRGDGALISAAMVRERPIETILSGPAASIVGARWLTGEGEALVSDIGGTTTDIALLRGGLPIIDPEGAQVGGFRTMVEAVAMRTWGLGGDSEVHLATAGLAGGLVLGPRRLIPLSLLAVDHPALVHEALDRALAVEAVGEHDGRFAVPFPGPTDGLTPREAALMARLAGPMALGALLASRLEAAALDRLVARGLVRLCGATPSDAAHVLGLNGAWDAAAAEKGLRLMARRRNGAGERFAPDAVAMAGLIVERLTQQTTECLLEAAFAEDRLAEDPAALARHPLTAAGLGGHRGVIRADLALGVPVVGLGASAPVWYPAVGARLRTRMVLPEHAGVANAIGAVVGQVSQQVTGLVTSPAEGRFVVHFATGPRAYGDRDAALDALQEALAAEALARAEAAGAAEAHLTTRRDLRTAPVEGREMFVEATVTVTATGRPRVAREAGAATESA